MRGQFYFGGIQLDRQSEAYRRMTPEDIVEDIPGSVAHPPCESLHGISLPEDYLELEGLERPKGYAQAEARLFERIMDPTAPDDNSSRGVYLRMRLKDETE
jgi:hypothetical protein